eukprot:gene15589-15736_t
MLSREDLYELVWAEPMMKAAERFDVSGSYLARICTLLNVPRPERGYWAKLAVGKAPPPPQLPSAQPGDPLYWSKEGEHVPAPKPQAAKPTQEAKPKRKIRLPREHIHSMIRGATPLLLKTRRIDDGMYLKPYKFLAVHVVASEAGLDKALDLANDLFNALESVGHRVRMADAQSNLHGTEVDEREKPGKPRDRWHYNAVWSPMRPTVVYVGEVAIGLAVIEMSERVTMRYSNGKYVRESEFKPNPRQQYGYMSTTESEIPSGRMRIIAFSPYYGASWKAKWDETTTASLRGQLADIVATIEAAAPVMVAQIAESDRKAEIRRQEERVAEERRRRENDRIAIARSIEESHADLRKIIDKWSEIVTVERFLAGLEQTAQQQAADDFAQIQQRLAEARSLLGTTDPLDFFRNWKTPVERYTPKYADRGE